MGVEQISHEWPHRWRIAGISITAVLFLTIFLYQKTVLYLTGLWNHLETGEYGHGYLVFAISVYIVWQNRQKLASLVPCPSYWVLPLVVASSLLWLMAELVDVNMVQAVSLLLLVFAITWMLLGNRVIMVLAFPILFLAFAIPIWFPLSPLLQNITADVVFWVIRLIEVPALRQENMIVLPAGTLSIEEACSGLRYLLAALTLGTLYAYLNFNDTRARLLVVLIAAITAVLANIVRVFTVVYLGYVSDMQHPLVQDHLMLGWYLFGGMVVILLVIDAGLSRFYRQTGTSNKLKQNTSEHGHVKTVAGKTPVKQYIVVMISAVLIVSLGPAAAYFVSNQSNQENFNAVIDLPESMGGWEIQNDFNDDWTPVYYGAINYNGVYQKESEQVIVFMGYYPSQKQGEELINDLNRISNNDVWRTRYSKAHVLQVDEQRVMEQLIEKSNGKKRLVWYWYHVAGRNTANRYEAKALQVFGLLIGKRDSSVVAVAADLDDTPESVRKLLQEFIIELSMSGARMNENNT